MKLILIGGPGAGKGTQARILSKRFRLAHISTGDLLREQMEAKTELGIKIEDEMNAGHLVEDEIVTELLKQRILKPDCENGFIIDGYPRNLTQAGRLTKDVVSEIDMVIYIAADDRVVIERMSGRKSCPKCGQMYHTVYNPPVKDGVCDACGTALIQREDDKRSTVANRLKIYHEMTKPIIDFYRDKKLLLEVNGIGDIDEITGSIVKGLGVDL